jgi:DNA polymerase III subunit delta'
MDRILGQSQAIDLLTRQLSTGRRHHAYIFHGPAGVGKFTTSLAYAKILLCHDRVTDLAGRISACDACPSCKLLRNLTPGLSPGLAPDAEESTSKEADDTLGLTTAHPDLHVVRKELARYSDDAPTRKRKLTRIPVEVLRTALIEPANLAAKLPGGKVFIVDEAELLNPAGQNALLKTLEEPPAGTTLILVTANEDRLLPTIRSRCMRIAFAPLADDVVAGWCDQHLSDLPAAQKQELIAFAGGSLGRAQLIARFNLLEWSAVILPALDRATQGKSTPGLGQQVFAFIDTFAKDWVDAHKGASKEAANKQGADLMWSLIATHARRRIAELSDQCDAADPLTAEALLEPWLSVIDATEQTQQHLASNVNLSLACDHLAASLTRTLCPSM